MDSVIITISLIVMIICCKDHYCNKHVCHHCHDYVVNIVSCYSYLLLLLFLLLYRQRTQTAGVFSQALLHLLQLTIETCQRSKWAFVASIGFYSDPCMRTESEG